MIDKNKLETMSVGQLIILENAYGIILALMDNEENRENWRYVSLKLGNRKKPPSFDSIDTQTGKIKLW